MEEHAADATSCRRKTHLLPSLKQKKWRKEEEHHSHYLSHPNKPLEQLDISGERTGFWNTPKASKQHLRVIHQSYSGHSYSSYLAFEDAKRIGEMHLVHHFLTRQVCEDEDQRIEFVFASVCHSGIQHVVVVNTKLEVTVEAAATFTAHFYNTLLGGRTIWKASAAKLDSNKVTIFEQPQPGTIVDDTLHTPAKTMPPAVPSFVVRAMGSGVRLLALTGNCGIGKSVTICERCMFHGGIFFADITKNVRQNKYADNKSVLNVIREGGEMPLVFDGLDQFGHEEAIQAFLQKIFEKKLPKPIPKNAAKLFPTHNHSAADSIATTPANHRIRQLRTLQTLLARTEAVASPATKMKCSHSPSAVASPLLAQSIKEKERERREHLASPAKDETPCEEKDCRVDKSDKCKDDHLHYNETKVVLHAILLRGVLCLRLFCNCDDVMYDISRNFVLIQCKDSHSVTRRMIVHGAAAALTKPANPTRTFRAVGVYVFSA